MAEELELDFSYEGEEGEEGEEECEDVGQANDDDESEEERKSTVRAEGAYSEGEIERIDDQRKERNEWMRREEGSEGESEGRDEDHRGRGFSAQRGRFDDEVRDPLCDITTSIRSLSDDGILCLGRKEGRKEKRNVFQGK